MSGSIRSSSMGAGSTGAKSEWFSMLSGSNVARSFGGFRSAGAFLVGAETLSGIRFAFREEWVAGDGALGGRVVFLVSASSVLEESVGALILGAG